MGDGEGVGRAALDCFNLVCSQTYLGSGWFSLSNNWLVRCFVSSVLLEFLCYLRSLVNDFAPFHFIRGSLDFCLL